MDWLERIDWSDHDGVNLPMINDVLRNYFYDNILRGNVRNRNCLDIGFGTGLLSLMALKHGARHVTAFESNPDRYELGKFIINQLGLENRISLINQRFHKGMIENYPEVNAIFHEAVGTNIWDEGIWNTFTEFDCVYLPGEYLVEIHALPVDYSLAQGLFTPFEKYHFNPGVDVHDGFNRLINELLSRRYADRRNNENTPSLSTGITKLSSIHTIFHQTNPHLKLINSAITLVSKYIVDVNRLILEITENQQIVKKEKLDFDLRTISLSAQIDKNLSDTWILLPRVGMKHGDHVLYLDQGHWGVAKSPIVLHKIQQERITINHVLKNGKFEFLLVE